MAPLIQHALEPVLIERLRTATTSAQKEHAILSLKVYDIACGSGHFLLAAARRMGKELARVRTGEDETAPERVRKSARDVISRCIYGVDKNPLAVEICCVALWLESQAEGKPLTFLDHRIRCGASLVGVFDLEVLEDSIPDAAFKPEISSRLDADAEAELLGLRQNDAQSFIGSYVLGMGFTMKPGEAKQLIACTERNRDCLFPNLNGEDLNTHPEQQPSRVVFFKLLWRRTRARFIVNAIGGLLMLCAMARFLNLYLTSLLFQAVFAFFAVIMAVVFQRELRGFFERL